MGWFSRKSPGPGDRKPVLTGVEPRDEERLGPAPPPPPTSHAPGITIHAFSDTFPRRLLAGEALGPPAQGVHAVAALVLSGAARHAEWTLSAGDLILGPAHDIAALSGAGAAGTALLVHGSSGPSPALRRISRGDLAGTGFSGITGIRALVRTPGVCVVRLGPPPGARWVLVGLESFAVFTGKFTVIDAEQAKDVRAGEIAAVSEPTATLHLQAGNDSALAIGFAAPSVVVALG